MADYKQIEKIEKVTSKSKVGENAATSEPLERLPPDKEKFNSLMANDSSKANQTLEVNKTAQVEKTEIIPGDSRDARKIDTAKSSLMDEVRNLDRQVNMAGRATPESLVAQAHDAIAKIDEIKSKLNTPTLELKGSVQNILRSKLSHIDENLKIALNKAGVEYQAPVNPTTAASQNPIERFLGFLTDGQSKLQSLANDVQVMHLNRKEISPASMLAIQIKVGFITQELEFFTAMLNKALESTKTIMNVQV